MNTDPNPPREAKTEKMVPIRTQQDREWEAEQIRLDFVKKNKKLKTTGKFPKKPATS